MNINDYDFKDIIIDGFAQKYTKVGSINHKGIFKTFDNYAVADVKTGDILETVHFQNGPIKENGVNGVAIEDLLLMVIDRLSRFNNTKYACEENSKAIYNIMEAVKYLRARTNDREARGVEGTSEV